MNNDIDLLICNASDTCKNAPACIHGNPHAGNIHCEDEQVCLHHQDNLEVKCVWKKYRQADEAEYLMPCGHGSRFLVVDPIKGCGTGLANQHCLECEWNAWAWNEIKTYNAAVNALEDKLKAVIETGTLPDGDHITEPVRMFIESLIERGPGA